MILIMNIEFPGVCQVNMVLIDLCLGGFFSLFGVWCSKM
jgi:hypothetical protein